MLCEKKNRPLMFRVDRKIPTHGSTVPVGNKASWDGGLSGWDFLVSIEHEWWIVFVWYAKTNFLSSYQLSSNSSPYVMALRVYIFENRRKNAPLAQISLRIRVVTRASVSHLKKWSWKYGLFIASQSCTLAPAELILIFVWLCGLYYDAFHVVSYLHFSHAFQSCLALWSLARGRST